MVRDDVGKVNEHALSEPVCRVEAVNHESGEVKEVNLGVDCVQIGSVLLHELVDDCCVGLVVYLDFLWDPRLSEVLIDLAALELGPTETADELRVALDGDESLGLWPGYSLLAKGTEIITGVGELCWLGSHVDLATSQCGLSKADSDHVQERTIDAFPLKGPIARGTVDGRRTVAEMELDNSSQIGGGRG
jgi:hypothetical protein